MSEKSFVNINVKVSNQAVANLRSAMKQSKTKNGVKLDRGAVVSAALESFTQDQWEKVLQPLVEQALRFRELESLIKQGKHVSPEDIQSLFMG
ncbi:hypothetical protein C9I92_10475 [Photobacterium ganghwense]|uniref:Uncharacterized protein n=1 Tax=Photobacterium ganghwense TaxID=320778 RepID=A0A0J1K794_9GAMM|nr:hypothetical protein [Photobacterium ganghwense]KLV10207.1 hypothetical protein ABT57_06430 [Photobacterium ganghwense]PSU09917.1 hypothetical protein C9I92_10475 [Photobacterium ganghwense]